MDDIDWERTSGAALRSTVHDHTLATEKGTGFVKKIRRMTSLYFLLKNFMYRLLNDFGTKHTSTSR